MSSDQTLLEVQHLSRRFHKTLAVDDLSFTVRKGEIVGFLGPNGAGKTTTMRMLTGYLPPSSGTARIAGFDVNQEALAARRQIGYMPENVPLYGDMRVKEYLQFRARLKGLRGSEVRKRVGEVQELCGISDVRRKRISNLSKGYRQRVGLADSLVHHPPLLILDEPTNGFDPNQIRQVRELIRNLATEHTVLLSTHILSEVESVCERVIILDKGRIRAADTPANLVSKLRTAGTVSLEIQADPQTAIKQLRKVKGVKKVSHAGLVDNQWQRFMIRAESGDDVRRRIVDLAGRNHWPLREISRHNATLEDVFIELTQPDQR